MTTSKHDNIKGLVFSLAIPSMLAQLVNILYSVVDWMYIGNIPEYGEIALAGVGVCGPLSDLIGPAISVIVYICCIKKLIYKYSAAAKQA